MKHKLRWQLIFLALAALVIGLLAYPKESQLLEMVGIDADLGVQRGLDLRGGVYLVYEAEITDDHEDPEEALEQARSIIQRRVNPSGASEAVVQTADNDRIIVQLPDEDDPQEVIELIGQTAQLEFFEINPEAEDVAEQMIPTEISGDDIARADAAYDQLNRPVVNLEFRGGESTEAFGEFSTRVYESGRQVLALLDGDPVFGPAPFQQPILNGESQLTGNETIQEAQQTARLLNEGALPVPVELVAQQTIGPTLGDNATAASVVAGSIGLLSLIIFLLAVYKIGGALAVAAMLLYAAAMVTTFKLSALDIFADYTIVLTLSGIAGFIMSIAVAADANILVLERLREERESGLKPAKAVEAGYNHAWSSIRDASIATLIICVVLYTLASRFGEPAIQGFALVLGVGVVMNVASVSLVTRTLLRGLARTRLGGRL